MALIGNGAQSEFQALAFHHLLGINDIRAYDLDPAATRKLAANLARVPGLRLRPCASAAEATRGADIVTTVTADKAYATILTADMVEDGMHLNAVGGDCPGKTELHRDVLLRASTFVEYEPQTRIEGDIQQMPADYPVTELWRVLAGQAPGRRDAGEVTLFDSVGFALEDYSALRYLADSARELGLGQPAGLIPDLADPRDLYALVEASRTVGVRAKSRCRPATATRSAPSPAVRPRDAGEPASHLGWRRAALACGIPGRRGACERVRGAHALMFQCIAAPQAPGGRAIYSATASQASTVGPAHSTHVPRARPRPSAPAHS